MKQLVKILGLDYEAQCNKGGIIAGRCLWYVRLYIDYSIDWDLIWEARISLKL